MRGTCSWLGLLLVGREEKKHVTLPRDQHGQRVLIVGDVHGCCDELRALLRLHRRPGDTIILAGDLVNKGPKNVEVVRLARELGCLGVAGNHELCSLEARDRRAGGARPEQKPAYEWTDGLSDEEFADADLFFTVSGLWLSETNLPYRARVALVYGGAGVEGFWSWTKAILP